MAMNLMQKKKFPMINNFQENQDLKVKEARKESKARRPRSLTKKNCKDLISILASSSELRN